MTVKSGSDVSTRRLVLRPFTLAYARDVLDGSASGPPRWAAAYPLDDEVGLLRLLVEAGTEPAGWGPWQVVDRRNRAIGGIGFLGGPDEDGEVEVGFGLVPTVRGAGLAAEALVALIGWAGDHGARVVHGTTTVDNVASQRTMINSSMRLLPGSGGRPGGRHVATLRFAVAVSRRAAFGE